MTIKDKLETINEALQTIIYVIVLVCVFALGKFLWSIAEQTKVETELMRIEARSKK